MKNKIWWTALLLTWVILGWDLVDNSRTKTMVKREIVITQANTLQMQKGIRTFNSIYTLLIKIDSAGVRSNNLYRYDTTYNPIDKP